jgi:hypothetical protein
VFRHFGDPMGESFLLTLHSPRGTPYIPYITKEADPLGRISLSGKETMTLVGQQHLASVIFEHEPQT